MREGKEGPPPEGYGSRIEVERADKPEAAQGRGGRPWGIVGATIRECPPQP